MNEKRGLLKSNPLESKKSSVNHLFDDEAIAIDGALDGDAEEGVIPDLLVSFTGRGAEGSAASHGDEGGGGGGDKQELLHGVSSFCQGLMKMARGILTGRAEK